MFGEEIKPGDQQYQPNHYSTIEVSPGAKEGRRIGLFHARKNTKGYFIDGMFSTKKEKVATTVDLQLSSAAMRLYLIGFTFHNGANPNVIDQ